ncbi:hypothetical protein [Chamaesiphon sp. OTE_75_metabat_556]|uniref:hypothetical protein n=1 Tax=Chamaesiphon sp. OTE_75_metabat_556 TaxID=2964692 RepID=UPI00286C0F26|nr:hypothetical protein [Chamaesiphon sp. OTE_75_metabat_556]
MTAKKTRKPMGDNAAVNNFVYRDNAPTPVADPVAEPVEPIVETVETVNDWVEPSVEAPAIAVAAPANPIASQPTTSLMSKLMQNSPEKEATVRLTVDLPKSTHTKLSILCAHNGLKKAEVVRMLLDEALKDTNV